MGKGIKEPAGAHALEPASLSELIHQHVRAAIETAVEEELRAALGTARYERREVRRGYRNGTRARSLTGPTGPVALTVPRATLFADGGAREWTSTILPRYQRRMREVNATVVGTYLAGGNTRRIRGALQPLLKAAPLSKSAVSRVVAALTDGLQTWRTRSLAAIDVIYVYLDGFFLRVRSAGKVVSVPVLGVVGVPADGGKQLLALELCGGESFAAWKGCVDDLVARGLRTPVLCVIDGNAGLRRAVGLAWRRTAIQRCCVHKLRNLARKAPKHALAEIRDDFHRIVYATNADAARGAYAAFERTWAKRCPGVVTSLREGGDELFTFFTFPKAQWKTLRTTNVIERLHEEFSAPREDTRLPPERRRGADSTLQSRGEWADQVAKDRRLAEDRRSAQPAYEGGSMMIRSAALIMVLAVVIPAALFRAEAQSVARAYRIGVLATEGVLASNPFDAFVHGLRDLGYVEGRNLLIEYRQAIGGPEQYRTVAAELAALRVDIIVTRGTSATLAAKAATTTIPIVVASAGDLVGTGVIASLARPGGNVTGLTLQSPELTGKRLALMKEVVPGVRKAIVLVNRNNPLHESIWKESRSAAHALNVDLEALRVGAPDELEGAFATATRRPAGVMMVPLDPMFNGQRRRLVALAAKHALPTMYGDRLYAEAGGLIAYGPSYSDLFRRAATYVDKILRGAKPRDLPVEQPTTFEMVINLKTAKALGLTIPPSLLLRADAIIQ